MKDEISQKIEHQRVAYGFIRCFPFYIWVFPNGSRRRKISCFTIILVYLMMLSVLVGVNLYYLYSILPNVINNDVFRVSNDNLNKLVDRVSTLKQYDMQVMINDILTFDSLLGDVSDNPAMQSTSFDPINSNPVMLQKSYENPQSNGIVNNTLFYVRPQDTAIADYTKYYQFTELLPWCKLLSIFNSNYFSVNYQDMKKVAVYISFGTCK